MKFISKKQRKVLELEGYSKEELDYMSRYTAFELIEPILERLEKEKYEKDIAAVGKYRADLLRYPIIEIER